jgi:hypothetical protein
MARATCTAAPARKSSLIGNNCDRNCDQLGFPFREEL